MNNRGFAPALGIIGFLAFGFIGYATYTTAKSGQLENNGKIIWCKMLSQGADVCDRRFPDERINEKIYQSDNPTSSELAPTHSGL